MDINLGYLKRLKDRVGYGGLKLKVFGGQGGLKVSYILKLEIYQTSENEPIKLSKNFGIKILHFRIISFTGILLIKIVRIYVSELNIYCEFLFSLPWP